MRATRENDALIRLDDFLRSQLFRQMVDLVSALPSLRPLLPELVQVRVVLDANPVQRELRWRLKWRRNPTHLSALHEAIRSGLVVAIAPRHLQFEIEKHFADIAEYAGCEWKDVEREWTLFAQEIAFYDPLSTFALAGQCDDPDDLAYLATWKEVDARAIVTSDRHLIATEAPVVAVLIDTTLRRYARSSTVRLGVAIGGSFTCCAGFETLTFFYRLLVRLARTFQRLPPAAQIAIAGAAVLFAAHPRCRDRASAVWKSAKEWLSDSVLVEALCEIGNQWLDATSEAERCHRMLVEMLPPPQKSPLRKHLRSVCISAGSPLSLIELERRVRLGGYQSESRTFQRYMQSVLRNDLAFSEVGPGAWTYSAT